MNYDLLFAALFYIALYSLFFIYRSRFDVQGRFFILYRTKLGLAFMDKIAKTFPRAVHIIGYFSIILSFIGMAFIFGFLLIGTFSFISQPDAPPVLTPVLPGVETVPGAPILSFWHWIIALFFIAIVHEFMHGVYARRYKIPIKSSGFAFLGPLLAAFVEPDEKVMKKKKTSEQLAVLSAGAFTNIICAFLTLLLLFFVFTPIANNMIHLDGVQIIDVNKNFPIGALNITPGVEITAIDNQPTPTYETFVQTLQQHKPGETIDLTLNTSKTYPVMLGADPNNPDRALLGVSVKPARVTIKPFFQEHPFLYASYLWFMRLLFWMFTINLGVGLFNLLPIGPVDGGRMFLVAVTSIFKDEKKARTIWMFITLICVLLIFINLWPVLVKFLRLLFTPLLYLITLFF